MTALACLFALGTVASGLSFISLRTPGGFLEPIWRLNPRGHEGFLRMGSWALVLLAVVCVACATCAYGFFTGRRWGYRLGVAGLVVNLLGDLTNAALGVEPRAIVGVPIVGLILWYLSTRRVREFFSREPTGLPRS